MCHPSVPDILQDFVFLNDNFNPVATPALSSVAEFWEHIFPPFKSNMYFFKHSVILVKVTNIVIGKGQLAFLQEQSNNSWQILCILQPLAFSFRMSNVEKQDVQGLRAQQFCQRDEFSITQQSQIHLAMKHESWKRGSNLTTYNLSRRAVVSLMTE